MSARYRSQGSSILVSEFFSSFFSFLAVCSSMVVGHALFAHDSNTYTKLLRCKP